MKTQFLFKKAIGLMTWFLSIGISFAQSLVITPSPPATSVINAVDIPAALFTGVPEITIPLGVIQGRKLSQPVSLSYQASGFKVSDTGGSTGLGWSLNGGGIVARVLRGRPDEKTNGYFQYANSIPNYQDNIPVATKTQLAENDIDMVPDVFYYSTGTDGGKFIFDNQLQPRLIPQKDVKITVTSTSTLNEFNVISEGGTKHIFTGGELTTVVQPFGGTFSYTSSWYLSKIISVDNTDTIKFNYVSLSNYIYSVPQNGFFYFYYMVPSNSYVGNHTMSYDSLNYPVNISGAKYLQSIESALQKVEFQFVTTGGLPRRLDKAIMYRKSPIDGTWVVEKTTNFSYSMFQDVDNGLRRLKLDSIKDVAPNSQMSPPYKFSYSSKKLPKPNSKAQDHWGYYNGANSNTNLIPSMTVDSYTVSTNDREVHSSYVDGCMLTKIVSPLGGTTEYYFESNTYGATTGPGLRISKIVQKDPYSSINSITNYGYNNPTTGISSGNLMDYPSYTVTLDVRDNTGGTLKSYYCRLINVYPTGAGTFGNMPVIYQYVTTYNNDDQNTTGKTVNKFSVVTGSSQQYPFFPKPERSWLAGNPEQTEAFKVVAGSPTIVSKTVNTFNVATNFPVTGLSIAYNKILFGSLSPTNVDFTAENYNENSRFQFMSRSDDYIYEQNSGTLNAATTKKFYYDNKSAHLQPTRIVTQTSNSVDSVKQEITYPFDYPAAGPMGAMQNLHMVSFPVETRTILKQGTNEYVIDYQKTDYYQWTTFGIYPEYGYRGKLSAGLLKSTFLANPSSYMQRVNIFGTYNTYGYLTESQRDAGIPSSIIFDSRSGQQTAQVLNARTNQIAYTSFESKDNGGWTIVTTNIISTDSKTGTHALLLTSGNTITKTSLQAGKYAVTYFEKDGTVTFTLSGGATLLSTQTVSAGADGWTLRIKHINVTGTGNTIQLTGSNIKIDELRLHPEGGIMSTTAYNECALPTTVTDAKMNSRHYEYDEWGRVKVVRDRNKNILEYFEYKVADN